MTSRSFEDEDDDNGKERMTSSSTFDLFPPIFWEWEAYGYESRVVDHDRSGRGLAS